tara:strand:+ start:70 stop:321 length:252 start_codon:yes stop_codon:yes gene_type:complete
MARFAGTGFDFAMGLAGGFLNMPTGAPSLKGGAGEAIGKAARMKVDQMTTGMQYNTVRQQAATRHFATTGQKVSPDLSLPPKG